MSAPRGVLKAGFLVLPHTGGTYSVFRALRKALQPLQIDLRWVGLSPKAQALREEELFVSESHVGHLIDSSGLSNERAGALLLEHLVEYDIVFINVLTSPVEMSIVAYLPPRIRRAMIIHSITPGAYAAARVLSPFVNAAVGVAPRIRGDLASRCNVPNEGFFVAPNALDLASYVGKTRTARDEKWRLLSLGRVVDTDKGVFWLPEILRGLADLPVHLTVAGDGPDLPHLKQILAPFQHCVTFVGAVSPETVPSLMLNHDILLMPSRFEGFGYTLIEAMAGGCVPVASRIRGTTDFVVDNQTNGILFPIGDIAAASLAIRSLVANLGRWEALSAAAIQSVAERFSIESLTESYRPVVEYINRKDCPVPCHNSGAFQTLSFGGTWRKFVPRGIKNWIRKATN